MDAIEGVAIEPHPSIKPDKCRRDKQTVDQAHDDGMRRGPL